MELLWYPLALIVMLGVLVTFHELGHFILARLSGVHVLRFSVGFGKPLWLRRDKHGTEFVIAALPLGGYVRMLDGQDPVPEGSVPQGARSYRELHPWWRITIAIGGPLANFILAILVYWWLFVAGTVSVAPITAEPAAQSAASLAGLQMGEEILSVDGIKTPGWQQITMALASRLGETGVIVLETSLPGEATPTVHKLPIVRWHQGEEEPDLLGSLGIIPTIPAVFAEIIEGSAAARAGLKRWDRVEAIDGEPVQDWGQWVEQIQASPDKRLSLRVWREGRLLELSIRPEAKSVDAGAELIGFAGVAPYTIKIRLGPLEAIPASFKEAADKSLLTLNLLKKMVFGEVSVANLSGPITIAKVAGDSARSGWRYFISMMALLSISLGVLNLLPIPILDGGHIIYGLAEVIRGQPVSDQAQFVGTQIGLFLVGGLMILALYNDIARLF